jgi:hypothetical protein
MTLGAAAVSTKSSDNDFDFKASQKQFNATNYNQKHLDEVHRGSDGEIYKTYCADEVQWRRTDDFSKSNKFSAFSLVEKRMEAFNINEPLDLRIHHKKFEFDSC